MAILGIRDYRNVALVGHGGAGKTTLAEACLFKLGVTNRLGSVPDGTSCLDYTDEEKEKGCSLDAALCWFTHKGKHINLIDTPGATDFAGPAISVLAGVETAVVVISASSGIEVNTRKMMERAKDYGLARMIVVNKIQAENINLEELLGRIRETFGPECVPMNLPASGRSAVVDCFLDDSGTADLGDVVTAHEALLDAIVGVNDALMEKYLGGEATRDEILAVAPAAVAAGALVPILFTDARAGVGVSEFLDAVVAIAPDPTSGKKREAAEGEKKTLIQPSPEGAFLGQVIKNMTDPKSHIRYSWIRVHRGRLTSDQTIRSTHEPKGMRPGQIMRLRGAEHQDIEAAVAGDIVGLAKLTMRVGETVYTTAPVELTMPTLPDPMFSLAVEPKTRGAEDKLAVALRQYAEEDPCFVIDRDASTHELVIRGVGDLHLRTILGRIARYHHIEVETRKPKIPYKETITARAENIEYTHKKQTGGAGQFGRVIINVLPNERGKGYEFVDKIFGGAIDQSFRPSVDKGIRSQMVSGVVAGYPVVDVIVELIDGKTHPVDSKDIAFQVAGREAFKIGFMKAKPILLEPIVNMEIHVPNSNMGDIAGDLASRRGQMKGQDMLAGGMAVIKATVPLAEVADYHSRLSSISGGQGSYSMEFSHYEAVPSNVQQQVVSAAAAAKKAE